jgi:ATP-dependent DNA helicase RecQ
MPPSPSTWSLDGLKAVILRHWGFRDFRPLQERAMRATLDGRDSLVVLPTGGGKSLCYQAPAVLMGGTTVVVSPLIALMKDQVDGLQACGVPAIQIDSSQSASERFAYSQDIRDGAIRLVFVSPERLVLTDFSRLLRDIDVRTFAIDEAHCISHWGHDFRPEYRQLSRLRELFPHASVHAYTATATERVRRDIVAQLALRDPEVLVGNFDRPNLTYRVLPRQNELRQVLEVIERHPGEGGIVYCIARREVDDLAADLVKQGVKAVAYHAGLTAEQRKQAQDAFIAEQADVVVATVAFGMGIDRSNIRFVMHARMPKSVEHYQQETGRAGRDGLEAECVLLYSGADFASWRRIIEKSAEEAQADPEFVTSALQHLDHMDRYSRGAACRHRALVEYFGQSYAKPACSACDVCLGDTEEVPDALVVAQKILSCVARVNQGFGINHVVAVLRGEDTEAVRKRGHEKLSTYGLLKGHGKADMRDWIYQLIGQGVLLQQGDEYPLLRLNDASWEVMKGKRSVRLIQLARKEKPAKAKAEGVSWEGVDRELFEALRGLRRTLAEARAVPPYVIVNDATLRELARVRPSSLEAMRRISGIGESRLRDFGEGFLGVIDGQCKARGLSRDQKPGGRSLFDAPPAGPPRSTATSRTAFELYRKGAGIDEVARQTGRARSTAVEYLVRFIQEERPASVAAWVAEDVYLRVASSARQVGAAYMRPIFVALGEQVPYDDIRVVLAHLATRGEPPGASRRVVTRG